MTKTLTEQWRDGELPPGKYYIKTKWWGCDCKWHYEKEEGIDYLDGDWRFYQDDSIVEVLAPVPDYKMFQFLVGEQKFTEEMLENIINIRTEELLKLNADYIKRVKKLEKRLETATKVLEDLELADDIRICMKAQEALKEIKEVK